jgi:hypothetical protein
MQLLEMGSTMRILRWEQDWITSRTLTADLVGASRSGMDVSYSDLAGDDSRLPRLGVRGGTGEADRM